MPQTQRVSDVRTQIYLPASWHRQLQAVAQNRGVSVASVIRDSVSTALEIKPSMRIRASIQQKERHWRRFMKMAGFARGKDISHNVSTRPGYYWAKAIEEKLEKRGAL